MNNGSLVYSILGETHLAPQRESSLALLDGSATTARRGDRGGRLPCRPTACIGVP